MVSRTGRARSTSSAAPPAMMRSVPSTAGLRVPENGASRKRPSRKSQTRGLNISRTQCSRLQIAKQLGPRVLGVANNDAVGVRVRVVWHQRDVRASENHWYAARSEVRGQFVCARGSAGNDRHADHIRGKVQVDVFDAFIDEGEFGIEFGRNERRESGERQRRVTKRAPEDAAAMAIQRSLR